MFACSIVGKGWGGELCFPMRGAASKCGLGWRKSKGSVGCLRLFGGIMFRSGEEQGAVGRCVKCGDRREAWGSQAGSKRSERTSVVVGVNR